MENTNISIIAGLDKAAMEVLQNAELESTEGMTEQAVTVHKLVMAINTAIIEEKLAIAKILDAVLKDALKLLNEEEEANQIQGWLAMEEPILNCLQQGGTYSLTAVKRDKDTGHIDEIVMKPAIVDLRELYMKNRKIVANNRWLMYCEAANMAIRDYMVRVMGIRKMSDKLTKFKLSAAAQGLGISEKDMRTAKGCQAALQKVVDAIFKLDDTGKARFTVTAEDAEVFRHTYAKWSNTTTLGVKLPFEATFRKTLTRILVRIVNNLEYEGE